MHSYSKSSNSLGLGFNLIVFLVVSERDFRPTLQVQGGVLSDKFYPVPATSWISDVITPAPPRSYMLDKLKLLFILCFLH